MIAAQDTKGAFMIKSQKLQNAARAKPAKKRATAKASKPARKPVKKAKARSSKRAAR